MPQTPMPQVHPIPPLFDAESRVLILGSFPSIKSREAMFFYGHPQNRFWPLLALLTGEPTPQTVEEKRALALRHHFALWDSIGQCTITGSSDSSIRDVVPNDLRAITDHAPIERIFCNGNTSLKYYRRYNEPLLGRPAVVLPSTSPANAAWSLQRLAEAWGVILYTGVARSYWLLPLRFFRAAPYHSARAFGEGRRCNDAVCLKITRWPGCGCSSARALPAARGTARYPAQRSRTAASRAPDGAG